MPSTLFPYAHCTGSDWRSICDDLLQNLPTEAPGNLAFIYLADVLAADTDRIVDYLRARTGVIHWVGRPAPNAGLVESMRYPVVRLGS